MRPGLTLDRWGPSAWNTLHAFGHSMPEVLDAAAVEQFRSFLDSFADLLPCPRCRQHFRAYLRDQRHRPLATREDIVKLLNDAHNDVNRRLGKRTWSYEEHCRIYTPRRRVDAPFVPILGVLVVLCLVARCRSSAFKYLST